MRIVFATFGSLGDLHPYLAVALELRARGHRPLIATHAAHRPRVERDGLEFAAVRPDTSDFGDPATWTRLANDETRGSEYVVRRLLLPSVADSFEDLSRIAAGADLMVSHTLTFAAPLVAERAGIPWVGTALQPTALFSSYDPPTFGAVPWLRQIRRLGPGVYRGAFRAVTWNTRQWMAPLGRLRAELGLPPSERHPLFEAPFSPTLNLALFSSVLASPQPDSPPHLHITGYPFDPRPATAEGLDAGLMTFLDAGPPPLVFTLGSSAVAVPGRFYVESAAAAARLGRRAVLLTGSDSPSLLPAPLPRDVLAVEFASHAALFPRASAIVLHGGIGTTGEALRAGRPMLFVPHSHDQPDNARRVGELGASLTIGRDRYRASGAARALATLLSDPTYAARAGEVAARVRTERGATTAADLLERAVLAETTSVPRP
jgi:rhamnosyltransferase subunit B